MSNNLTANVVKAAAADPASVVTPEVQAVLLVIVIIVLAGVISGSAAFLTQPQEPGPDGQPPARQTLLTFSLLGVIAAACIPLFLSLTESVLMDRILTPRHPERLPALFVFAGLCLIAAFTARTFLDSITRRVLERVNQAEANSAAARAVAAAAERAAQEAKDEAGLGEAADEADAPAPVEALEAVASFDAGESTGIIVTDEERRILEALNLRTYRTRTGIAEDSAVPRHRISELLESMADRRLALPTTSPRTGGHRWIITKRGQQAIAAGR